MESNTTMEDRDKIPTREQLKRARATALVLATTTVISMLFFVYGQVKSLEAEKNQTLLLHVQEELKEQKEISDRYEQLAKENEEKALQAINDCQKNKH